MIPHTPATSTIHRTPYIRVILTQKSLHASHILPTLGEVVAWVAWVECHNLSFTPSSRFESTLGLLHRHAQCDSPKYCSCKADRRIMCNCPKWDLHSCVHTKILIYKCKWRLYLFQLPGPHFLTAWARRSHAEFLDPMDHLIKGTNQRDKIARSSWQSFCTNQQSAMNVYHAS